MEVFTLFLIYLPAFLANATPVVISRISVLRKWDAPMHEPTFGAHKTWRGFVCGFAVAGMVGGILALLNVSLYISLLRGFGIGFTLGIGALGGDLVKSFFKRRIGLKPGTLFQPWDGIDYILGAILILSPMYLPTPGGIAFLLLLAPVLSITCNTISWLLGWKEVWY